GGANAFSMTRAVTCLLFWLAVVPVANAQKAAQSFDPVSHDTAGALANIFMSWSAIRLDIPPPYDFSQPAQDTVVISNSVVGIWGADCGFEIGYWKNRQPLAMIDFKAFTGEYQERAAPDRRERIVAFGNGHPVAWQKRDSGEFYWPNYISLELTEPRSLLRSLRYMIGGIC